MAEDARQAARKAVRDAQAQYEQRRAGLEEIQGIRQKTFAEAQEAGLSLREIADATGLHWTRIGQIIREG